MQEVDFIFSILILIMSVVVHEVSHGYVANILGDPTARLEGRLTLNPIKHLDPVARLSCRPSPIFKRLYFLVGPNRFLTIPII